MKKLILGFVSAAFFAGLAWAETVELVTYYPPPTVQRSDHVRGLAVGDGYLAVTPDDGELLVFDRVGIGPGFDTTQPAPRLDIRTGAVRITMDAAADPAQQLFIRGATDNGEGVSIGFNTTGNYASIQSYAEGTPGGELFLQKQAGNVKIGPVGSPLGRLHVYEPTSGSYAGYFQGTTHGGLYGTAGVYFYDNGVGVAGYGANYGVYGYGGNYGVYGYGYVHGVAGGGANYGVYGNSANTGVAGYGGNYGVYGNGTYYGVYAQNSISTYPALYATNLASVRYASLALDTYGLYTNGAVHCVGFTNASSLTLKKDVSVLSAAQETAILSRIDRLPLVQYHYKIDPGSQPKRLGVIAEWSPQEVQGIDDDKAIDVTSYITYSVAGVKALSAQVKQQQEELRQLKQQLQQFQEKNTL